MAAPCTLKKPTTKNKIITIIFDCLLVVKILAVLNWHFVQFYLPRTGFWKDSCKLKTTLSTNRLILLPSEPLTNNSQSCVNPSGDVLFFFDDEWPISNATFIRILLQNHKHMTKKRRWKYREKKKTKHMYTNLSMVRSDITGQLKSILWNRGWCFDEKCALHGITWGSID